MFGKQRTRRTREQYERDIRLFYGRDVITLFIAQANSYFSRDIRPRERAWHEAMVSMSGVLSAGLPSGDHPIRCQLNFIDFDDEPHVIGGAHLTHLINDEKLPYEDRKLRLEISINDRAGRLGPRAYEVMRDAAISRQPFARFRLYVQNVDADQAIRELRERGTGPGVKVLGLSMWPDITLPDAPKWAWLNEGEDPY